MASRLYLVRHGLVHNPDDLCYGHLPRFKLAPDGRRQAAITGRWLAARGVSAVVASPLLRARQTARLILTQAGPLPLHIDRRLRESELSRTWQGLPWERIAREHAELYSQFESSPSLISTGETMTAMASRVGRACRAAVRRYPGLPVALVSHRDPIVALRLALDRRTFDELHQTPCAPASVTLLEWDGRRLHLAGYEEPH